ncbi:MAG TPA: FAD-dependent monooxygenase [Candidatus Baltobacteraceae bacterium]
MSRVVIAGAGPVGLSLALGLARYGIESTLIERKRELDPHSRAIVLWPRTLEILAQWGVLDAFVGAAPKHTALAAYAAETGARLVSLDLGCIEDQTETAFALFLPQDRTEQLLLAAVRATGLAEVVFESEVVACADRGDYVETSARRSDGSTVTYESAFLVGADGARGFVRSSLGYELEGKTYPLRTLLADIVIDDERDQLPFPRISVMTRNLTGAVRYAEHTWRVVALFAHDEVADDGAPERLLPERIEQLFGAGPVKILWTSLFRTHARRASHFAAGRIALAGDAAHLNSPAGGQGMNAGIADAHNLAWKLARALGGGDTALLLESYDIERRDAIAGDVERFTDALTRVAMLPTAMRLAAASALDLALTKAGRARGAARRLGMLDIPYRRSTLFDTLAERVGHRAPDLVVDGERLYARMGLDALLLAYHAPGGLPIDENELRATLTGIPGVRLLVVDGDHGIAESWRASRSFVALIRPDHYVGLLLRSWTPESLRAGVRRALGA